MLLVLCTSQRNNINDLELLIYFLPNVSEDVCGLKMLSQYPGYKIGRDKELKVKQTKTP